MKRESGKRAILLMLAAVASVAALVFGRRADEIRQHDIGPREREVLARRLSDWRLHDDAAGVSASPPVERQVRLPAAATADANDPRVGADFGPTLGVGGAFNPAGALLESFTDPAEPSTAEPAEDAQTAAPLRKHVVADGDTLGKLAARYLGNRERYLEIFAANRSLLSKPDLLPIGAVLIIPPATPPMPPADRSTAAAIMAP